MDYSQINAIVVKAASPLTYTEFGDNVTRRLLNESSRETAALLEIIERQKQFKPFYPFFTAG